MDRQLSIFDDDNARDAAIKRGLCDPTVAPEAVPRLSRQCQVILDRLRQGMATNDELIRLSGSRNFSARISDLRRNGHHVVLVREDHATGETWYELR